MAKVFNSFEKIAIKNAAKAVAAIRVKQEKVRKEIENLEAKIAEFDSEIKVFEDSVTSITCGYKPQDLVAKVERESGKQSDWVFVYPDTIVPVVEESTTAEQPETEDETPKVSAEKVSISEPAIEDEFADEMPADAAPDPMDDIFKD